MPVRITLVAACLAWWLCWGQAPSGPSQAALDGAVRLGAVATLSHTEAEALEAFAETPASNTRSPLAHDPELVRADRIVQAFRLLKAAAKPGGGCGQRRHRFGHGRI